MVNLSSLHWAVQLGALGLSLLLSMTVALVYVRLNRHLASTRPFAQALAMAGVVSAIIVLAVGDSIARGIGLVGALTVIRFRSDLKDPRDLIFAFAALATGVAAGAHAWTIAIGGTAIFLAAAIAVSRPWFAQVEAFDAVLSIRTLASMPDLDAVGATLRRYCETFILVRVRQANEGSQEQAYQVRLKASADRAGLVQAIKQVACVEDALLVALEGATDAVASR